MRAPRFDTDRPYPPRLTAEQWRALMRVAAGGRDGCSAPNGWRSAASLVRRGLATRTREATSTRYHLTPAGARLAHTGSGS